MELGLIKEFIIDFNLQKDFTFYLQTNFILDLDFIEGHFPTLELLTIMKCFNQINCFRELINFKKEKNLVADQTSFELLPKAVFTFEEKELHPSFIQIDYDLVTILRFAVQKYPMTFYLN
jgi:hypothetical protein